MKYWTLRRFYDVCVKSIIHIFSNFHHHSVFLSVTCEVNYFPVFVDSIKYKNTFALLDSAPVHIRQNFDFDSCHYYTRISPVSSDPQILRTWLFHEKYNNFLHSHNPYDKVRLVRMVAKMYVTRKITFTIMHKNLHTIRLFKLVNMHARDHCVQI